jgi:multiple antibiotic resistance protein
VQATAGEYQIGTEMVFTVLFIMLGPLKLVGPFGVGTRNLEPGALRPLALKATGIATVTVLVGGFVGMVTLQNWNVSVAALSLAAGIVFFLVSLKMVMVPYEHPEATGTPAPLTPFDVAFPLIVTPYGIAALIALLSNSRDAYRVTTVMLLTVAMMVLDLLAMIYVRPILKTLGVPLKLLGAVLGVLLLALAVQTIIDGLRLAGLVGQ